MTTSTGVCLSLNIFFPFFLLLMNLYTSQDVSSRNCSPLIQSLLLPLLKFIIFSNFYKLTIHLLEDTFWPLYSPLARSFTALLLIGVQKDLLRIYAVKKYKDRLTKP